MRYNSMTDDTPYFEVDLDSTLANILTSYSLQSPAGCGQPDIGKRYNYRSRVSWKLRYSADQTGYMYPAGHLQHQQPTATYRGR
jgi:hypothetical protein